jgi:diacylglycerol kinase family enzyme
VVGLADPVQYLRPIGLGRVNGRFFCFHTGVGYDAAVVRAVERHASLKRWAGHPLFIYAALSTWLSGYDRRHPHFTVSVPGTPDRPGQKVDDGYFSIVLNTNPYTFLGNRPLDLSPSAGLDQPLVVVTFRTMSALAIIGSLAGALRGDGVRPDEHVSVIEQVHEVVIEDDRPFPYQLDGDYLGESSRLHFEHVPDAARLLMPPVPER